MQDKSSSPTNQLIRILQESSELLNENGTVKTEDVLGMVARAATSTEQGISQLKEASSNLHPKINDIVGSVIAEKRCSSVKPSTQISATKDSKSEHEPTLAEISYTT